MKRLSFGDVLDILFYSLAVWFLLLGILRYYRLQLWLAIFLAALFALLTGICVFVILRAKRQKKAVGKREKEARDALLLHLALEKEERVRALLLNAYLADGHEANCLDDEIEIDGIRAIPFFTMEPISADAVASILRRYGSAEFALVCNSLSPDAERLLSSFGKRAVKGDEVYALFARTETMPEPLICGEIPRKTIRRKLRGSFSKKNARPFFVSGLLLLIMSLFVIFPVYYLIMGGFLMISAILVRAFGYAEG